MEDILFETHYEYFLAKNELRMNKLFRSILWCTCLVGPAIAIGVFCEIFDDISYGICVQAFLISVAFALGHSILYKFKPESHLIKYLGLFGLLIAIFFMSINHLDVFLCYFFVPMTSLLYCSRKTYILMSGLSLLVMLLGNWYFAGYHAGILNVDTVTYYVNVTSGQSIEYMIMFLSGIYINELMIKHLQTMYDDEIVIDKNQKMAYSDQLTGLWNRRYMEKAFDKYVVVQHNKGAMLVIDMDNMKIVNDIHGHLEGDRALRIFAKVMKRAFLSSNAATICRFGGDEFVVLLPYVQSVSELTSFISKLMADSDETFRAEEKLCGISISVGAAFVGDLDMNYETVFERADRALYNVKNTGRNSYQISTDD